MRELCLYNLEQAAVIVLDESGIQYFNHTGVAGAGIARAVGYLVPVSNDPPADQPDLMLPTRLSAFTTGQSALTKTQARDINNLLMELSSTDICSVNESRLHESAEGWVYITVSAQGDFSQFQGFAEFEAVLTWPVPCNSPSNTWT
jgi:hypothetical protein